MKNITIEIIDNGTVEKSYTLEPGEFTIGRDSDNDIILNHKGVSKKHAFLSVTNKDVTFTYSLL